MRSIADETSGERDPWNKPRRKPIAVSGYLVTALGTAVFGFERMTRPQQ